MLLLQLLRRVSRLSKSTWRMGKVIGDYAPPFQGARVDSAAAAGSSMQLRGSKNSSSRHQPHNAQIRQQLDTNCLVFTAPSEPALNSGGFMGFSLRTRLCRPRKAGRKTRSFPTVAVVRGDCGCYCWCCSSCAAAAAVNLWKPHMAHTFWLYCLLDAMVSSSATATDEAAREGVSKTAEVSLPPASLGANVGASGRLPRKLLTCF